MKESGIASLSQSFCVSLVDLVMHLILKLPRMESKIFTRFNYVVLYCAQETLCYNEWEVKESGIASLSQSFCVLPVELLMHLILRLTRMESKIFTCLNYIALNCAQETLRHNEGEMKESGCLPFSVFLCVAGRAFYASYTKTT